MKPEAKATFTSSRSVPVRLTMALAIGVAKEAVASMTALAFDSISRCEKRPEGGWIINLDVIESMARMGDNDLLATYEVVIDADGDPQQINRTRRYHREDKDQA